MGEFEIRAIGLGALLPAAVGTAVVAACAILGRDWRGLVTLGGPLALAAGIWVGFFALALGPFVPPRTGWQGLPHLAVLVVPAGWAVAYSRRRVVLFATGVVSAFIAIAPIVPNWPPLSRESIGWTLALGEWILVVALVLIDVIPPLPKSATVAAMIGMVTTASLVLFVGGNARFAQTAGIVAAALGGAALVVAVIRQDVGETIVRGLVPGFAVTLVGLTFSGYHNSYQPALNLCYLLVTLSPLALAVVLIPGVRRQAVWLRVTVALGALSIPLAAAAARAALAYSSEG